MQDLDVYGAIEVIENPDETTTRDDVVEAMQLLIDRGIVWSLQGFYGRAANDMIRSGECHYRN
jgi:hypothetical protein